MANEITQQDLEKVARFRARLAKAKALVKKYAKAESDLEKKIVEKVRKESFKFQKGTRYAEVKEVKPRGSVGWQEEWAKLALENGIDVKVEKERLLDESKAGKKSKWKLIVE